MKGDRGCTDMPGINCASITVDPRYRDEGDHEEGTVTTEHAGGCPVGRMTGVSGLTL